MNISRKTWIYSFIFFCGLIFVYKTVDNLSSVFEFLQRAIGLLTPFIIGGVIAFLLLPPARAFEKWIGKSKYRWLKKSARSFATLSVVLLFVVFIILFLYLFLPALYQNLSSFTAVITDLNRQIPGFLEDMAQSSQWGNLLPWENLADFIDLGKLLEFLGLTDLEAYTNIFSGIVSGIFSFAIGLVSSIYMLLDRARLKKAFIRLMHTLMPKDKVQTFFNTNTLISKTVYKFFYGQSLDALIAGTCVGIALLIIGEPTFLALALIYFLCSLVPFFGAIVGVATVSLFTAMSSGLLTGVIAFVVVLVIQQIDSNILYPRIVGGALNIRPLAVIFGVTMGAGFFGLPGMLLGAPAIAIIFQLSHQFVGQRRRPLFSRASILQEEDETIEKEINNK